MPVSYTHLDVYKRQVGSGSNCTATQVEKSVLYQDMGADALLLIAPYYNKANPEGMYRHFAETADQVHIPCILYNVPGRTGCSIPVSVVERLSRHPNIAGIKEASGDKMCIRDRCCCCK